MGLPDTGYTVQLASSDNADLLTEEAAALGLTQTCAIYPFRISVGKPRLHGLACGHYKTYANAVQAVEKMSKTQRQFDPWIRPLSGLKNQINTADRQLATAEIKKP